MTCTITLVDGADPNSVGIELEFDPPIGDDQKSTAASNLAMKLLEHATTFAVKAEQDES